MLNLVHVARIRKMGNIYLKGRDHSEDLSVPGKIILEWILGKSDGKV
jgi:hypothetical protein